MATRIPILSQPFLDYRQLLNSLIASPTEENLDHVAEQLKCSILGPPPMSEWELKTFAEHIFHEVCFCDARLLPLLAKLLFCLKNTVAEGITGFYLRNAISSVAEYCYPNEPFSSTVQRIKFVSEMLKLKLVDTKIFLRHARQYAMNGPSSYSVPIIYEILCNYDKLFAEKVVKEETISVELRQLVCYLAAIFKCSGPVVDAKFVAIDCYLTAKALRFGHTHSTKCEHLPGLPAPKSLLEQPDPMVNLLRSLQQNPINFDTIAGEIRSKLSVSDAATLDLYVAKILDTISERSPICPPFRNVLEMLHQMKSTIEKSLKNWLRRTFTPENSQAIDKIWFHNELCFCGFMTFSSVIGNLTSDTFPKTKEEARLYLVYRFLASFDELVEKGRHFGSGIESTWVSASSHLANSLRKKPSVGCAREIWAFLALLDKKGGWHRQIGRQIPTRAAPAPSSVANTTRGNLVVVNTSNTIVPIDRGNTSGKTRPPPPQIVLVAPTLQPQTAPDAPIVSDTPLPKAQDDTSSQAGNSNISSKVVEQPCVPLVSDTPLPQLPEPVTTSQEPGLFRLTGDIDGTIDNLKQYLEMQPPRMFSERVGNILDKMFGQIDSDQMLEAASKLCMGLSKVTSSCDKCFIIELQENCLNWFNETYQSAVEAMLSNMQQKVESTNSPQEKAVLAGILDSAMLSYYRKTTEYPKLVAKLFSSGCLAVSFVISFLSTLISTKSEVIYRKIFEMLVGIGGEVQNQATMRGLDKRFQKIFEDLAHFLNRETLSDEMKKIIQEILTLKQNGWMILSPEQRAVHNLNSMLFNVEHDSNAFESIRNHLRGSPMEMCHSFYDILVSKLEEYASKLQELNKNQAVKETSPSQPCDGRKRPATYSVNDLAGPSKQSSNHT